VDLTLDRDATDDPDATVDHDASVDREAAEDVLRRLAGPAARLRDDQWTAIEALVGARRRVLLVQRTGFGKSAVYFVATSLLRRQGAGPTVIVSPLLALMRNQVEAAAGAGIRAATINSANVTEWADITKARDLLGYCPARRLETALPADDSVLEK